MSGIGTPTSRLDGPAKVTGRARYGSDTPVSRPVQGCLVTSTIARGRIVSIDETRTRAVPGVLEVFTYRNIGSIVAGKTLDAGGYIGSSIAPMASDEIHFAGQIVALVVADTFEAANEAAERLAIAYSETAPSATFDSAGTTEIAAKAVSKSHEDPSIGDAPTAFAEAPIKVDVRYQTPTQHHNPIELFSTLCAWSGKKLTIWESSQNNWGFKNGIADQIGIDPNDVEVISPFVGGAFGSRGSLTQRTAIIALAAKKLGRPIKVAATRAQGFTIATYRAETRHHLKLAASRDGRLVSLSHEGFEVTSRPDNYMVAGTDASTRLYACPNIASNVSIVHADRNTPGFMRSPAETPYIFALECAMDELSYALGIDPVELRRLNDTKIEPIKGLPYSSRSLVECFDAAGKAFGWAQRDPKVGGMRDGDWLVGWGTAATMYPTNYAAATARVTLFPDGTARVQCATHEIGQGVYTVCALVVADRLAIDPSHVTVELGNSNLPPAPVAGGSNSTASVSNVLAKACDEILQRKSAGANGAIEAYAENIPAGGKPDSIARLYKGQSSMVRGTGAKDSIRFAFGAHFVEVRVHSQTGEIRVPRATGAFAAGRIVNPKTAESQLMGAMIWGISCALHEATEIDRRYARYYNTDLAEYLIPVNADIGEIDVILIPEKDDIVNPLGIKGLGELGNVGLSAAVCNAVYHATGVRVRELPVRIEKVLPALMTA